MTIYDKALDDDAWREQNFSQELLHSARYTTVKQPTVKELIAAAERFGTEGILETAVLLSQGEYRKVETAVKKLGGKKNGR